MHKGSTFRILRVFMPCFLIAAGVFLAVHPAFAQTDNILSLRSAAELEDWMLTVVAELLNVVAGGLGKIALVLIEMLIVPILNYNSFSTSTVIGLGWSLMRDIVNMFVIIALLAIAILTIVGDARAHWEQQLPRLFLAVVLVNFSRTICGLLIDVSQVVMFTFVNALLDIAAGNFAQLFSLNEFGKISDITAATEASSTTTAASAHLFNGASNLINAFLQIPLYGSIVIILLLLGLAFIYRIVVLWILVILSPAAFFLGGMHDVFHIGGAHAWWEKFTGALVMGPLLTFFLWLALAASSAGSITETENFPIPDSPQTYGLALQAFQSDSIASTLVALVLLIVGMQQAGTYASRVGGMAGQAINEGIGRKIVAGTARSPFTLAGYGARAGVSAARTAAGVTVAGAQTGGRLADRYFAPDGSLSVSEAAGKRVMGLGDSLVKGGLARGGVAGAAGVLAGRTIIGQGGKLETYGEHTVETALHAKQEEIKAMGDDQRILRLEQMKENFNSVIPGRSDEALVLAARIATDSQFRKKTKEHYEHTYAAQGMSAEDAKQKAAEKVDGYLRTALPVVEAKQNLLLDDTGKQKLKDTKSGNLDLLVAPRPVDPGANATQQQKDDYKKAQTAYAASVAQAKKFIDSDDFVVAKLRDRPQVLENPEIVDALANKTVRTEKNGQVITALDEIYSGKAGVKMRDQARAASVTDVRAQQRYRDLVKNNATADAFGQELKSGRATVAAVAVSDIASGTQGDKITQAIVNSNVDVTNLGAANPADKVTINEQFVTNVATKQSSEVISRAISNGQVTPSAIPADAYDATKNPNLSQLVLGIIRAKPDASKMDSTAQDAFKKAVQDLRTSRQLSVQDVHEADALLLQLKGKVEDAIAGFDAANSKFTTAEGERRVAQLVKNDPAAIRYLKPNVGQKNAVTQVIVKNISDKSVNKLGDDLREARDNVRHEQILDAMKTMQAAVKAEIASMPVPVSPGPNIPPPLDTKKAERERLRQLDDQINTNLKTII